MEPSKESVAEALAEAHFAVEPGLLRVIRLLAADQQESDPKEPIKLLEINRNTTADGILPVYFGPHEASGIVFPSVIVEVTPKEFDRILADPSSLPNRWQLGREFPGPATAVAS